ncbi:transcriptional regulator [Paenibacillus sp. CAA11]|uniref:helix-turn-helix domain-containing protein n=1 Tax=Paenibacillus sp. CAA11 TaxID=1532905 RepID=UPI000D3BC24A|nr:helix-turn-helix transcriptional regulator [Paenibacillus sp. CAA11]AWB43828.1 transcriptional regulator [Paenibacillus sp. CAA11]
MHSIYERIEQLIKLNGMTKKRFCEQLGISTGNLGDWKRGKSTPSSNKLIEIAAFFDVSLDWLMLGKERRAQQVKEPQGYYVPNLAALDQANLTPEEEAFILEYIEFVHYRKRTKNGEKPESN